VTQIFGEKKCACGSVAPVWSIGRKMNNKLCFMKVKRVKLDWDEKPWT
jgi:hypothetical protein